MDTLKMKKRLRGIKATFQEEHKIAREADDALSMTLAVLKKNLALAEILDLIKLETKDDSDKGNEP